MKEIHIRLDDAFDREVRIEALRRSLSLQRFVKAALAVQLIETCKEAKLEAITIEPDRQESK